MHKFYLLLLCYVVLFKANCQPGSLDTTFGNNGVQTTAFFSNINRLSEEGRKVLTCADRSFFVVFLVSASTRIVKYLPDGRPDSSYGNGGFSNDVKMNIASAAQQRDKIIVTGYASDSVGNFVFALARFTADGTLDSSFGVNGLVTTTFGSSLNIANSITIQEDKIVVAGYTVNTTGNKDFAIARYMADGRLDASFGVNGRVTTDFGYDDEAIAIVTQGDKIVAGGYTYYYDDEEFRYSDFALARYTADGKLDASFGVNGKVTTDITFDDQATAMTLQGDKIIMSGGTGDYFLARYAADGSLDATFGVNGIVRKAYNGITDVANAITLQGDNIIVGGMTSYYKNNDFVYDFFLVRYTTTGILDSSFGTNGKVTADFGATDGANSLAVQGSRIVAVGSTYNPNLYNSDIAIASYTVDGALDASFGNNGLLVGYFPTSYAYFTGTAIQGNNILAAGSALRNEAGNEDFVLARYTPGGALDSSFGKDGKVTTDFNDQDQARSIALQGKKIVVAGSTDDLHSHNLDDFALTRYTADGVLDRTFGVNGKVITDFNNRNDDANSIAIQGDKIIVGGYSVTYANNRYNPDFALARYTADGVLDATFGVNGKVTTDFGFEDYANTIALQGNKIIMGGTMLARYTENGTLDHSFGKNGKVIPEFSLNAIVLSGDKIIASGSIYNAENNTSDFALARYTADGRLDSSFGVNGKTITDFGYDDYASSISLQGDKFIIGGNSINNSDVYDEFFALARYTSDGVLDSSFGTNGKVTTHLDGYSSLGDIALYQNRLYAVGSFSTTSESETYGIVGAYQLEAPEPSISIADVTVSESKRFAVAIVRLSKPTNKLIRVYFTTRDKTAVHNEDYLSISGPLFFIPGVNNIAKIFIPIIDDNKTEGDEQFEIVLSNVHNASIQDSIGVVTIVDDDNAPIAKEKTSLHINVSPNPSANVFTIQLQGSNLKQPISMRVYDVGGRMIEQRENISIGQILRLGEQYKAGTYIIEVVQGSRSIQTKVIKTNN